MHCLRSLFLFFAFAPVLFGTANAGAGIGDKALLQAGMQKHIEDHLVQGAYLHLDGKSGKVQKLFPDTPHPMILTMGEYFVLCSNFRDAKGKEINVDFYMARKGSGYMVFKAAVEDRDSLKRLMRNGMVSRLN
jgi:hypothetical protein